MNWQADLHTCGFHLSETLDKKPSDFIGVFQVCPACSALQRAQEAQEKKDEPDRKAKRFVASAARLWRTLTRSEAEAAAKSQQQQRKKKS